MLLISTILTIRQQQDRATLLAIFKLNNAGSTLAADSWQLAYNLYLRIVDSSKQALAEDLYIQFKILAVFDLYFFYLI